MQIASAVLLLAATAAVAAAISADNARCAGLVLPVNVEANLTATYDTTCLDRPSDAGCFASGCRLCRGPKAAVQFELYNPCPKQEIAVYEDASTCTVSDGDQKSGLSAYYDAACPGGSSAVGGLGCQPNKCRFCKTSSANTSPYVMCPSSAGSPSGATAPSPATSLTESSNCVDEIARSGYTQVEYVADNSCNSANPTTVGCVKQTSCLICRVAKNDGNERLISCKVLRDAKKTESAPVVHTTDTFLAASTSNTSGADITSSTPVTVIATTTGAAAVVLAIAAVLKAKKNKKSRNVNAPCTPINGSLITLETCIPNL